MDFQGNLCPGFLIDDFYYKKLLTLRQRSTVDRYKAQFQFLQSLVSMTYPDIDEAYFASCCLNGLKEEIRKVVQLFRPVTVSHVLSLAGFQESILDVEAKLKASNSDNLVNEVTVYSDNSDQVNIYTSNTCAIELSSSRYTTEMVVCDKVGDSVYDEIAVHDVNQVENHIEEQLKCTECVSSHIHVSESDVLDMVVEAYSGQKEEEANATSITKHERELSTHVQDSEHFWVDKQIVGDYYCRNVLAPATNPMRDKTACYLDNFVSSPKLTKSIICDVVQVGGPTWIPTMQQFLKYFSSDVCFDPGISCSDKIRFHIFSKMFSIQCSVTIHVLSGIELFVQNEQLRWLLIFSLSFNPQGNLVVELVYSWPREKYSENMSQIQSYEDKAYGLFGISLCCSHVAAPIKFKDLIFEGYKLELLPNYTLSRSIRIINGQYFLPFKESVTEFNITQVWTVIQALQPNFESSIPAFEVGNGYIAYMVIRFCCSLELQISGNANSGLVILLAVELYLVKLQSSYSMYSRERVLDKDRVAETHSDADNTSVDEVCVRGVWLHGVLDYISLQWHGQVSTSSYTYLAPEQGHFLNILHLPTVWLLHNFIERNALEKRMEATVLTMQLYSSVPMCTCAMDEKNLVYSYTGICDFALSMDSIILSSTEQPPHDFKGYKVNEHLKGDILSCLVSSGYICEVEYSGHRTKFCAFVAAGQYIISMILLWDSICSRVRLKNHRCLLCLVVHSSAPIVEWILSVLVILSNFRMLRTHKWHVLSVKKFNTDSTTVLHSSHCKSALHTTQGYKLSHGLILPEHTVGDHSGTAIQLFLLPQGNAVGYWVLVLQGANSPTIRHRFSWEPGIFKTVIESADTFARPTVKVYSCIPSNSSFAGIKAVVDVIDACRKNLVMLHNRLIYSLLKGEYGSLKRAVSAKFVVKDDIHIRNKLSLQCWLYKRRPECWYPYTTGYFWGRLWPIVSHVNFYWILLGLLTSQHKVLSWWMSLYKVYVFTGVREIGVVIYVLFSAAHSKALSAVLILILALVALEIAFSVSNVLAVANAIVAPLLSDFTDLPSHDIEVVPFMMPLFQNSRSNSIYSMWTNPSLPVRLYEGVLGYSDILSGDVSLQRFIWCIAWVVHHSFADIFVSKFCERLEIIGTGSGGTNFLGLLDLVEVACINILFLIPGLGYITVVVRLSSIMAQASRFALVFKMCLISTELLLLFRFMIHLQQGLQMNFLWPTRMTRCWCHYINLSGNEQNILSYAMPVDTAGFSLGWLISWMVSMIARTTDIEEKTNMVRIWVVCTFTLPRRFFLSHRGMIWHIAWDSTGCYEIWYCTATKSISEYSVLLAKWNIQVVLQYVIFIVVFGWIKPGGQKVGGYHDISAGCVMRGEFGASMIFFSLNYNGQLALPVGMKVEYTLVEADFTYEVLHCYEELLLFITRSTSLRTSLVTTGGHCQDSYARTATLS